jgi:hypothetical protein
MLAKLLQDSTALRQVQVVMDKQGHCTEGIEFQKLRFSGFAFEDIDKLALILDVGDG